MDQRGQVRLGLDPAVLPSVRGQPGADGSVYPSVQSGELPAQAMPAQTVNHWSLRIVQLKLIKIEGRLARHARRLVFQLAEVAVSREVFRQVLERIAGLHPAPG